MLKIARRYRQSQIKAATETARGQTPAVGAAPEAARLRRGTDPEPQSRVSRPAAWGQALWLSGQGLSPQLAMSVQVALYDDRLEITSPGSRGTVPAM